MIVREGCGARLDGHTDAGFISATLPESDMKISAHNNVFLSIIAQTFCFQMSFLFRLIMVKKKYLKQQSFWNIKMIY